MAGRPQTAHRGSSRNAFGLGIRITSTEFYHLSSGLRVGEPCTLNEPFHACEDDEIRLIASEEPSITCWVRLSGKRNLLEQDRLSHGRVRVVACPGQEVPKRLET
jgi:hypothetical protein